MPQSAWSKAESIGAGRPTFEGIVAREKYGDPLAEPVIRRSTPGERASDWMRGLWDSIKEHPLTQVALLAAGSSPEQQEARWTEPPPDVSLGMTDRPLAARRLLSAFARKPMSLRQTLRQGPEGLEARPEIVSRMEDALELGRGRPADWDLRKFEASAGSPENLTRVARTYGAVSPSTQFVDSLEEMYKALLMRERGVPITPETLRQQGIGVATAKAPNIRRAFEGNELVSIDQRYPGKTEDLTQLMLGSPRWIPDRHGFVLTGQGPEAAVRPLLAEFRAALAQLGMDVSPGEAYRIFQGSMTRGMERAAGGNMGVETFPTIWEGIRSVRGEPYQRGIGEIMRDVGSQAPGALTDPRHLEEVVKRGLVRSAAKVR